MRKLMEMLELTRREQLAIVILVLLLVIGRILYLSLSGR
jgi:hypothetical protein